MEIKRMINRRGKRKKMEQEIKASLKEGVCRGEYWLVRLWQDPTRVSCVLSVITASPTPHHHSSDVECCRIATPVTQPPNMVHFLSLRTASLLQQTAACKFLQDVFDCDLFYLSISLPQHQFFLNPSTDHTKYMHNTWNSTNLQLVHKRYLRLSFRSQNTGIISYT